MKLDKIKQLDIQKTVSLTIMTIVLIVASLFIFSSLFSMQPSESTTDTVSVLDVTQDKTYTNSYWVGSWNIQSVDGSVLVNETWENIDDSYISYSGLTITIESEGMQK
jgi:basic membrane lipoprotein Med (substrate-binding protein (PBP1-ABC) superfamily)